MGRRPFCLLTGWVELTATDTAHSLFINESLCAIHRWRDVHSLLDVSKCQQHWSSRIQIVSHGSLSRPNPPPALSKQSLTWTFCYLKTTNTQCRRNQGIWVLLYKLLDMHMLWECSRSAADLLNSRLQQPETKCLWACIHAFQTSSWSAAQTDALTGPQWILATLQEPHQRNWGRSVQDSWLFLDTFNTVIAFPRHKSLQTIWMPD